jgi:cobyrinic acid a,c-diamide synthase
VTSKDISILVSIRNQSNEEKGTWSECGGMMYEGECSECGYMNEQMYGQDIDDSEDLDPNGRI